MKRENKLKQKNAQEEMVGFAIIVIIVAVIMLVFLSLSMIKKNNEVVGSTEVESFIAASIQYTTNCQDSYGDRLSVRELILKCNERENCTNSNNERACDVLGTTINGILNESWKMSGNKPVKGYLFNISGDGRNIKSVKKGNVTSNSKGDRELLSDGVEVGFTVYY